MSDGAIGRSHVTIPDLLEPVVGFRKFRVDAGRRAKPAWVEKKYITTAGTLGKPYEPFIEPNDYVVDPVSGKLVKDYIKVAEAFKKWQDSLGEEKVIHHPATPATGSYLISPTYSQHIWSPEINVAQCGAPFSQHHNAPEAGCECGLYSYYYPWKTFPGASMVAGIVTSWGKIEAHPTGMRSEFMQIHALLGGSILDHLGSEWQDVVMFNSFETTLKEFASSASEFGSPLPKTLRPKPREVTTVDPEMFPRLASALCHHDSIGRKRVKRKFKWPYWLICLLLMNSGLWVPHVFAGGAPAVRNTPPARIRQCYPPRTVFERSLSVPANCLLRPMESPDG